MAIRVGRWDCKACGYKGNLGVFHECHDFIGSMESRVFGMTFYQLVPL